MTAGNWKPRGFSLIELMFSMAIGSVVLLLAASLLASSGDSYDRVGGNVASEREARACMTQLAMDLSTASHHRDQLIERSTGGWRADRLGFLSLQPPQAQTEAGRIGDMCAVNYYLKDLTIGGKIVRCLMRGFRESNETFKALRDDRIATLFAERDQLDEPVAFGVVSFEIRPEGRGDFGKPVDWEKDATNDPASIGVKLAIARRELAARLTTSGDWNGAGSAGKLLGDPSKADRNQYLEIYSTTLRFGNHASH